jgi:hypothetical protein
MTELQTLEAEVAALAQEQADLEERLEQDRVRLKQVDIELAAAARAAVGEAQNQGASVSAAARDNAMSASRAVSTRILKERPRRLKDPRYRDSA